MLENHGYASVVGSPSAPFLNSLAASGALLTQSYAITHPSQPNYLALFGGSTFGVTSDSCGHTLAGPDLASELLASGHTFVGYSEDQPSVGYTGCSSGKYARKHNPWSDFPALPPTVSQPFTAFPHAYDALPTVAFVVPNLDHDMHDGTVHQADEWLRVNLSGYASWASTHNSLLIVTMDENDGSAGNRIPTILDGAHVRPGANTTRVTHYNILRTLLDAYGLAPFGDASAAAPLTTAWE